MITFNGSQKQFFKTYPMEKRSLNETYKLINSAGETLYKFIKTTGEKNFKKVTEKELTNETEKKDDSKVSSKTVELKPTVKDEIQDNDNKKEEATKTVTTQSVKTKERGVSRKEEICNRLEEIFTYGIEQTKKERGFRESSVGSYNYDPKAGYILTQYEWHLRVARICVREEQFYDILTATNHALSYACDNKISTYLDREELSKLIQEIKDHNYFGCEDECHTWGSRWNCGYCGVAQKQASIEIVAEFISEGNYRRVENFPQEACFQYFYAAMRELNRCYERIEHLEDLLKQVEDIVKTRDNCQK